MTPPGLCKWCGVKLTAKNAYASRQSKTSLQSKCTACDREWGRKRNASDFRSGREDHGGAGVGRKLPPQSICRLCCGLPHRVEGDVCECGLRRGERTAEES